MMRYIRPNRSSWHLLLGILMLVPLRLFGAEQVTPQTASAIPVVQESDRFDSMEGPRNYLSAKITRFANEMDRFFGGDRHYQESNQSVVQLSLTRALGYGGDRKYDLAARVNLKLPESEGKLRLLLETDPEKNISADPAQGHPVLSDKVIVPGSAAVAVRYTTEENNVWHFSTDAGLKFPIPVKPFVRARGSYSAPLGKWQINAAESLYWFNTLGVGATSKLDLDHIISSSVLFRSSSNATWLNDKHNIDMRQDLSVFHTLNDRTALLYQVSAIGVSNPSFEVTDYVALLLCRYRMHKEWLFFEISPQLHFPRERNFKASAALSLRMEVLFDDSR